MKTLSEIPEDMVTRLLKEPGSFDTPSLINLVRLTHEYTRGRACHITPLCMAELERRGVLPHSDATMRMERGRV